MYMVNGLTSLLPVTRKGAGISGCFMRSLRQIAGSSEVRGLTGDEVDGLIPYEVNGLTMYLTNP